MRRSAFIGVPASQLTFFSQPFEIADYDMMRPLTIAACFALTAAAFAAAATDPTMQAKPTAATASAPTAAPAAKGDVAKGRQLIYTCQGCHGVEGYKNAYPNYHVPKIGGQTPEYIANALTDYRKGTRKHPTMQAQAQSFSDQDIADIAAYLSNVK